MNGKRLSVPLSDEQHKAIKLAAMLSGKSIKDYTVSKLFPGGNIPNAETLRAIRDVEDVHDLTAYSLEAFLDDLRTMNDDS